MIGFLSAVPTTSPAVTVGSSVPTIPPAPYVTPVPSVTVPGSTGSGFTITSGQNLHATQSAVGLSAGILIVVALLAVLALLGVFVIIVVANRADPDPSGRRPQSVYFFAVSFVTIMTSIIGSTVVVSALVRFIGSHPNPISDSVARTVVLGGLITLVSTGLLVTHLRRGLTLALADPESTTPSRRIAQTYVAAVAFVVVVVLLVVTVLSVYLICALAGPGVFGSLGGRAIAGRYLIASVYVGAVSLTILWTHRNLVPPGLHFFGRRTGTEQLPAETPPSADVP
jgi:hypothetical protein